MGTRYFWFPIDLQKQLVKSNCKIFVFQKRSEKVIIVVMGDFNYLNIFCVTGRKCKSVLLRENFICS